MIEQEVLFWILVSVIGILWVIVDELRLESRENDD
jgi:hypothetical protein